MIDAYEYIDLTDDSLVQDICTRALDNMEEDGAHMMLIKVEAALEVLRNKFVMGDLDS